MDPTTTYASKVVNGEIIAGRFVRAACKRHLEDLKNGHKRGLRFDVDQAGRALRFFPAMFTVTAGEKVGQSSSFTTANNEIRARLLFRNKANASGLAIFAAPVIRRKAMGELIVDGAIIALKIATNAVTTAKILAGAITATELGAGAVTAIKI